MTRKLKGRSVHIKNLKYVSLLMKILTVKGVTVIEVILLIYVIYEL